MLKHQLFKTSGLQFGNWLFRPEKFSGLSFEKQAPVIKRQAELTYVQLLNA